MANVQISNQATFVQTSTVSKDEVAGMLSELLGMTNPPAVLLDTVYKSVSSHEHKSLTEEGKKLFLAVNNFFNAMRTAQAQREKLEASKGVMKELGASTKDIDALLAKLPPAQEPEFLSVEKEEDGSYTITATDENDTADKYITANLTAELKKFANPSVSFTDKEEIGEIRRAISSMANFIVKVAAAFITGKYDAKLSVDVDKLTFTPTVPNGK